MSISSATAICKGSGTQRNGNLGKAVGEGVKSVTKGTITFTSPSRNGKRVFQSDSKSYHFPAQNKDPDHSSLLINFFIYRAWGWKQILHECACLCFWRKTAIVPPLASCIFLNLPTFPDRLLSPPQSQASIWGYSLLFQLPTPKIENLKDNGKTSMPAL